MRTSENQIGRCHRQWFLSFQRFLVLITMWGFPFLSITRSQHRLSHKILPDQRELSNPTEQNVSFEIISKGTKYWRFRAATQCRLLSESIVNEFPTIHVLTMLHTCMGATHKLQGFGESSSRSGKEKQPTCAQIRKIYLILRRPWKS